MAYRAIISKGAPLVGAAAAATGCGVHSDAGPGIHAALAVPLETRTADEGWVVTDMDEGQQVIFGHISDDELEGALGQALKIMPRRGKSSLIIEALDSDSDSDTCSEGGLHDAVELMREAEGVLSNIARAEEAEEWTCMVRSAVNDPAVQEAFLKNAEVREVLRRLRPDHPALNGGPMCLSLPPALAEDGAPQAAGSSRRRRPRQSPFEDIGEAIGDGLAGAAVLAKRLFKNLKRAVAEAIFQVDHHAKGRGAAGPEGLIVPYDAARAEDSKVDWLLASATAVAMSALAVVLFRRLGVVVRFAARA